MSDFNPLTIRQELEVLGEDWADKKAAYEALHEVTKTVLADIKRRFTGSDATKTTEALAHSDYRSHLNDLKAARLDYLHAEVKWKTGLIWAELMRTEQSNIRAHLKP